MKTRSPLAPMPTFLAALAAVLCLTLVAAGCGSDQDNGGSDSGTGNAKPTTTEKGGGSGSKGDAAFPVTIKSGGQSTEIAEKPTRIVSLSPAVTEILFAVGAGKQVKAVDDQSNYPPEAPRTKLSGYKPNVEAIANEDPDVVFLSDDNDNIVAGLSKLKIPVIVLPTATSLDDAYHQIELTGDATGHSDRADEVVDTMKTKIKRLLEQVPDVAEAKRPTAFHELDNTLYTVTSKTFIGQLYEMAGYRNIADAADKGGKAGGYPQLSAEYLLAQDPDVIFLADTKCCQQSVDTVAARPGWKDLKAVQADRVVTLDDDVASRWGPRVVDFFETLVKTRTELAEG